MLSECDCCPRAPKTSQLAGNISIPSRSSELCISAMLGLRRNVEPGHAVGQNDSDMHAKLIVTILLRHCGRKLFVEFDFLLSSCTGRAAFNDLPASCNNTLDAHASAAAVCFARPYTAWDPAETKARCTLAGFLLRNLNQFISSRALPATCEL